MKIDHIYCINLERSIDRREAMVEEFKRENLDVEFFKACDGKALGRDGVFGCAQSHLQVWRDAVKHGHNSVLVLEDDAKLDTNFKDKLEKLIEPDEDWDVLYLFGLGNIFITDYNESFYRGKAFSCLGYIISKNCVNRLSNLEYDDFECAIDEFLAVKMNLKTFISKNQLVLYDFERQKNSEIGLLSSRQITRWGIEHFIRWVDSNFGVYILLGLLFILVKTLI